MGAKPFRMGFGYRFVAYLPLCSRIAFFKRNSICPFTERKSFSAIRRMTSWRSGSIRRSIFFLPIIIAPVHYRTNRNSSFYLNMIIGSIIISKTEPQIDKWINHRFLFCLDFSLPSGTYNSVNLHWVHEIIISPSVPCKRAFLSSVKLILPHLVHFPFFIHFTSATKKFPLAYTRQAECTKRC